ncbi:hypothetical protein [Bacillus thuringiensis]|uniref:hypothetical protein n=1 Tax=Bacillus thuringiensis TaxID=1428 RepID=UPI0021D65393|nr:hypothetical protein [Bacillus thuringiensis]MCU7667579.1 hypothetical protein [Bacillus thuringiensis]
MGNYSNKSDEELERIYEQGNDRDRYRADEELVRRGLIENEHGNRIQNDVDVPNIGGSLLFILGLAAIAAGLLGALIIVAGAVVYEVYIYIGFILTFALMYLAKGRFPFVNFLFYLGCLALATRLFANVIEMMENVDFATFINRRTDGLGVIIKYGFLYAIYIFIIPLFSMKLITSIVRKMHSKSENKNSKLNV